MKLNAVIVDDEILAIDLVKHFIEKSGKPVKVQATFGSPVKALEYIRSHQPELLLLDIQMPGINGLKVIRNLDYNPIVVLVTAYSNYAHEAFDLDVVDYLLKPYTYERFCHSLEKALDFYRYRRQNSDNALNIKHEGLLKNIAFRDILFVEGLKQYVKIVLHDQFYILHDRMKNLQKKLEKTHFLRVHKSYIVNTNEISRKSRNMLHIGKYKIPVGRKYRDVL